MARRMIDLSVVWTLREVAVDGLHQRRLFVYNARRRKKKRLKAEAKAAKDIATTDPWYMETYC